VLTEEINYMTEAKPTKALSDTERKALELLQQIVLLYPSEKTGPKPTATVDTRETFDQTKLINLFNMNRLTHGSI